MCLYKMKFIKDIWTNECIVVFTACTFPIRYKLFRNITIKNCNSSKMSIFKQASMVLKQLLVDVKYTSKTFNEIQKQKNHGHIIVCNFTKSCKSWLLKDELYMFLFEQVYWANHFWATIHSMGELRCLARLIATAVLD